MKDFKIKTIFITGGSSGIGLAIAKAFAQQGNNVVLFARTVAKLESAVDEIKKDVSCLSVTKSRVNYYSVDTSNFNDTKTVFEKAIAENGIPDILINCVGIAQPDYFENITPEIFDKTIKTNLYSTWNACSVMVPFMKQKGGHIVNTSSIAGYLGVFGYTDYSMSKFGIVGFSEALRQEMLRFNIRVSILCPPDTDTPGFEVENKHKPNETKAIAGNVKLMSSEMVAAATIRGIQKNEKLIIPSWDGKTTLLLKRFFPNLVDWFMKRSMLAAQK
ncbi:MAG: SDR family oxidoreductase [Chitinophagales bacterium]|nr:SDR family oxidoreductase [Chitinophagales bacterium]MBP6155081.1 SDR family oxidoreductase [Chitinophagales bacterium]